MYIRKVVHSCSHFWYIPNCHFWRIATYRLHQVATLVH